MYARITCQCSEPARKWRMELYKSNQQQQQPLFHRRHLLYPAYPSDFLRSVLSFLILNLGWVTCVQLTVC